MQSIMYKHKILGFDEFLEPVEITDELYDVGTFLSDLFSKDIKVKGKFKYCGNIKNDVRKFFKRNLLEVRDIFVCSDKIDLLLEEFQSNKIKDGKYLLKEIQSGVVLKSPFDIPLKYDSDDIFGSYVKWAVFALDDEYFLKNIYPIYREINLSDKGNKTAVLSYIHEIMHTQLESNKGIIKKYYHSELLSIFLEKVAAFQKDPSGKLFVYNNLIRYMDILQCLYYLCEDEISFEDSINYSTYIVSSLKAEKLFDIYLKGNDVTKELIMDKIQLVMDGVLNLENMLSELEINLENSCDINILKKHI